jgi:hypothetical protein
VTRKRGSLKQLWTRTVFRLISVAALTLTILCIGIIVVDTVMTNNTYETPAADPSRSISVGVERSAKFESIETQPGFAAPEIDFCPESVDRWKVRFGWKYFGAKGKSPEQLLQEAPTLYITAPLDAQNVAAGLVHAIVRETGENIQNYGIFSDVRVIGKTPLFLIISVRPRLLDYSDGSYMLPYVTEFSTGVFSRYSYGLGSKGFKLSYAPELIESVGYQAGIANALAGAAPEERGLRLSTCDRQQREGYDIPSVELDPAPVKIREKDRWEWVVPFGARIGITGVINGGFWYTIRNWAPTIASNSVSALLGAIFGIYLESRNGGDRDRSNQDGGATTSRRRDRGQPRRSPGNRTNGYRKKPSKRR